jgi:uncharacterized protein (TIGR02301 family)
MASMRSWLLRTSSAALAVCMLAALPASPAHGSRYWYLWDQNLLDLAEIMGSMHYLQRLCGNPYDQTWRDRMIDLMDVNEARGARRARLVSRFNKGHDENRQWYDRCSRAARFKIEQTSLRGEDLIVWFSVNRPY